MRSAISRLCGLALVLAVGSACGVFRDPSPPDAGLTAARADGAGDVSGSGGAIPAQGGAGGAGGTGGTDAGSSAGQKDLGSGAEDGPVTSTPTDAKGPDVLVAADGGQPVIDAPAPPADVSTKLSLGASCANGTDCASTFCTDGVCCNRSCGGQCEACDSLNSLGTCTLVMGQPHVGRTPCTGTDECKGTCRGSLECSFPNSTTSCGPAASCSSASLTPRGQCNGSGACSPGKSDPCPNNFACADGSRCATKCQSATECTDSTFCSNQTCRAKKALGALCSNFNECSSSVCGGRCCSAPCTCPQPSAKNTFSNAGFDSDLTNWCSFGGLQWTSDDADGCPFSGSATVVSPSGCPTQCVPVAPGGFYNFGGWFKSPSGSMYVCYASAWSEAGCGGSDVTAGTLQTLTGTETGWTVHQVRWDVPATARSLRINCEAPASTHFDKLFLTPIPGGF